MRTFLLLVSASLLISGCTLFSDTTSWTKPNTTPEQAEADLSSCKRIARAQRKTEEDIDQDQSAVLDNAQGAIDTEVSQSIERERSSERMEDIVDDCMRQLGYSPAN